MNEYCTKITRPQWDILVKMCDELGIKIPKLPVINTCLHYTYVKYDDGVGITTWTTMEDKYDGEVSFPYFLTELRKIQQWTPKAGEMVEVSHDGINWLKREFMALKGAWYWCFADDDVRRYAHIRPITPNITRAEAEAKLKTLGVNVRITD